MLRSALDKNVRKHTETKTQYYCMNEILFATVILLGSSCSKDPLKYTQNLNGMHTWIWTKFDNVVMNPPYDTMQPPIIVINNSTIVFSTDTNSDYNDTLRLSSSDNKNEKNTCTSEYGNVNYKFIARDTIEYHNSNGALSYCHWSELKTRTSSYCYSAL